MGVAGGEDPAAMDARVQVALKRRFRQLDINGDGELNFKELQQLLRAGQSQLSDKQLALLFHAVDRNGSGKVDFEEFVDFVFGAAPTDPADEWFDHVLAGDLEAVERLAGAGAELDARDMRPAESRPCCCGLTAVMHAAVQDRSDCLAFLAEQGADLNLRDTMLGVTAAMLAAEEGRHECLLTLIEHRANLDVQDDVGKTATMLAAALGHLSCLRLLVRKRAALDLQDNRGWTATMLAAKHGHTSALALLAEKRANVNLQNSDGQTALMLAVLADDELCVKILVENGSNLLLRDSRGNTAAMEAERKGHETVSVVLLENSRGVRLLSLWQSSQALPGLAPEQHREWFDAAWHGREKELRRFVDEDASLGATSAGGWNATMIASLRGHSGCLQYLIGCLADVNAKDEDGWTAAMLAAKRGHVACLELLVRHGADLGLASKRGLTASILAAKGGHVDCLRLLMDTGTDISSGSSDGATAAMFFLLATGKLFQVDQTVHATNAVAGGGASDVAGGAHLHPGSPHKPLDAASRSTDIWFRAVERGFTEVLQQLAGQGVPVDTVGRCGMTAAMLAAERGDMESLGFLMDAHADLHIRDRFFGRTAVGIAAAWGQWTCIRALIDKGLASPHQTDATGRTAVMEAAYQGHEKSVRILARRGAPLDTKDSDGLTAAELAAQQGHVACLRVLAEQGASLLEKRSNGTLSNPLLLVEHAYSLDAAMSVVVNWAEVTTTGVQGMCAALKSASMQNIPDKYLVASLHLNLWREDEWGQLQARSPDFSRALSRILEELLVACKDRELTKEGKRVMTMVLEAGLLRAVDVKTRAALKSLNSEVLTELEKALNARQEELKRVATLTDEPDVRLPRRDRHGKISANKLDQRDAMPASTWEWLVDLPADPFKRLELAFQAFRMVGLVATEASFMHYLRDNNILTDGALYAKASAHLLVGYAEVVEGPFERFMHGHFGSQFKPAPVKKLARIFTKLAGDEPRLTDESAAAEDENLRCAYFTLGDAVRGSIRADGPEAMEEIVQKLQRLSWMSSEGKFEVWRIKNTHHEMAEEMTGGYRDVKVLGRFTARKEKTGAYPMAISMIVEVQVIDVVYLDIKNYMHKAYAIDRGDYD